VLVELNGAGFGYGRRTVVHVDHLSADAGACLGIYGPNGSGKTTLVRGITGLLPPLSGGVSRRPRLRCEYLPQRRAIGRHWPMSGFDAAALAVSCRSPFGWLRGAGAAAVNASMARLGVGDLARRPFATLSGGQQQRLMLAGALAAAPELLVLDEPTEGLDAAARLAFLQAVREELARGLAAVLVSHDVEDLEALCTQVARLHPAASPLAPSAVTLTPPAEIWQHHPAPAAPSMTGDTPTKGG
jgi:ABC-type Mn2+/Zn2+ transport system ATPase subunit